MSSHEPECPAASDVVKAFWSCQCDRLRAAYRRGYTAGYNDHARARAYQEQVYGPYGTGGARDVYTQHGTGENP